MDGRDLDAEGERRAAQVRAGAADAGGRGDCGVGCCGVQQGCKAVEVLVEPRGRGGAGDLL